MQPGRACTAPADAAEALARLSASGKDEQRAEARERHTYPHEGGSFLEMFGGTGSRRGPPCQGCNEPFAPVLVKRSDVTTASRVMITALATHHWQIASISNSST